MADLVEIVARALRDVDEFPRERISAIQTAQAEAVLSALRSAGALMEWRAINDDARSGDRLLMMWRPGGGFDAHVELGRWSKAKNAWCNTYGHPFSGEPDCWSSLPQPPEEGA